MINLLDIKVFYRCLKNLLSTFKQQDILLKKGLREYKNIILYIIPICFTIMFLLFDNFFDISLKTIISNLISTLPSLTGFLIASLTILISMNNKLLDKVDDIRIGITYRQIGASLFLYATKIALTLIILAFIVPSKIPHFLLTYQELVIFILKAFICYLFSKLLFAMFYGLLIISTAIQSNSQENEENEENKENESEL